MATKINLDKELEKIEETEIPEPPMVCETPEGWSPLAALDVSECWYERVLTWERMFGRKMLPLKYSYDENGTIVLTEELEKTLEKGKEEDGINIE